MARRNLSLPHERRKYQLKSAKMRSQVIIADHKERVKRFNDELKAMTPTPKKGAI